MYLLYTIHTHEYIHMHTNEYRATNTHTCRGHAHTAICTLNFTNIYVSLDTRFASLFLFFFFISLLLLFLCVSFSSSFYSIFSLFSLVLIILLFVCYIFFCISFFEVVILLYRSLFCCCCCCSFLFVSCRSLAGFNSTQHYRIEIQAKFWERKKNRKRRTQYPRITYRLINDDAHTSNSTSTLERIIYRMNKMNNERKATTK